MQTMASYPFDHHHRKPTQTAWTNMRCDLGSLFPCNCPSYHVPGATHSGVRMDIQPLLTHTFGPCGLCAPPVVDKTFSLYFSSSLSLSMHCFSTTSGCHRKLKFSMPPYFDPIRRNMKRRRKKSRLNLLICFGPSFVAA